MHKPYDRQAVLRDIEGFGATSDGQSVTTRLGERLMRTVDVSNQYQLFDFKKYITSILSLLERQINPKTYYVSFKQGVQEINLLSAPLAESICGDEYCLGFYILNSTDKTRALQFMAGLYRVNSGTEVVVTFPKPFINRMEQSYGVMGDAATYCKVVHKGMNFQNKIDQMRGFVSRMDKLVFAYITFLEELAQQKVSLKKLFNEILYENAEYDDSNNVRLASASKVRAQTFARQLLRGSDKIMLTEDIESPDAFYLMAQPLDFIRSTSPDIYVNAYQAFQCYLNAYRTRDTSVLRREGHRFTGYLEAVGTEPSSYQPTTRADNSLALVEA